MNRLVSRNLSTQLAKHLSSPYENRVEGVPVIHLQGCTKAFPENVVDKNILSPAHVCQRMNGRVDFSLYFIEMTWRREGKDLTCACSFSRKLLSSFYQKVSDENLWAEHGGQTWVASSNFSMVVLVNGVVLRNILTLCSRDVWILIGCEIIVAE